MSSSIHTIDLHFQKLSGAIAVYLIPHTHGAVLVECGPGSTIPSLVEGLHIHGYTPADITDVLLTHIHLDHGGSAGWWARQGARIHVHPNGAPHLLNPEKLLASATRIYGEMMGPLWGEFLPVPEDRLSIPQDGDSIEIEGLVFHPLDTPGHAGHHYAYIFENTLFSGDIGGIRLGGLRYVQLPMPPPEFHPGKWRNSLRRLCAELEHGRFSRIAPTHFGIYSDSAWHLGALGKALDQIEAWMEQVMPSNPPIEDLRREFVTWSRDDAINNGLTPDLADTQEAANPAFMSADGISRYWRKERIQ